MRCCAATSSCSTASATPSVPDTRYTASSCDTNTCGRCTFNRLVDLAGVRRTRLHDIRHTYATLSLDGGITPKIVSDRIDHSNLSVTFQVYGHRTTGQDREAAELVTALIHQALDLPSTQ